MLQFVFTLVHRKFKNSSKRNDQLNSAEIRALNCNSTDFEKNPLNQGVSFVETLGKKTKTYLIFVTKRTWLIPIWRPKACPKKLKVLVLCHSVF